MKAIAIMYHDIVESGGGEASGFSGAVAAVYKVERARFDEHLEALAAVSRRKPVTVRAMDEIEARGSGLFITFDDGGRSAYTHAASALERHGWRGHFFVATNYIDAPAFLSTKELRELHDRGHVVGSHSASHPLQMAWLSWDDILREWRTSIQRLSEVLRQRVCFASVPGGHFSKAVARAASEAGIKILFTSEPTTKVYRVDQCTIVGRYTIHRSTPSYVVASVASGNAMPRIKQLLLWNTKKIAKALGGRGYLKVRRWLLAKNCRYYNV
jgi:peptidoglycan/xylan/chitin deacetylase (PgdA/CDA1 family)